MDLRTARKQADLTISEVARRLGVTRQTIYNWEAGKTKMTVNTIIQLADLYGLHISDLLSGIKY